MKALMIGLVLVTGCASAPHLSHTGINDLHRYHRAPVSAPAAAPQFRADYRAQFQGIRATECKLVY